MEKIIVGGLVAVDLRVDKKKPGVIGWCTHPDWYNDGATGQVCVVCGKYFPHGYYPGEPTRVLNDD
jgi:hypothetical protein